MEDFFRSMTYQENSVNAYHTAFLIRVTSAIPTLTFFKCNLRRVMSAQLEICLELVFSWPMIKTLPHYVKILIQERCFLYKERWRMKYGKG